MSLICETSELVQSSVTSIFKAPPTDATIINREEFCVRTSTTTDSGGDMEYIFPGNGVQWLDLSTFYVKFVAGVRWYDGTALTDEHKVGPVNLFHLACFEGGHMKWKTTTVSSTTELMHDGYFKITPTFGLDAKKSHLELMGYVKDTAGHMDDTTGEKNKGLGERMNWFANGKRRPFMGPLMFDGCHTERLIPPNVDVIIVLRRARPEKCLMAGMQKLTVDGKLTEVPPHFKLDIFRCEIFGERVQLLESTADGLNKGLELAPARYFPTDSQTKKYTLSAGISSYSIENISVGKRPKRVTWGFVRNDAILGNYGLNPLNFQHCNLTQTSLHFNGLPYPTIPFMPNYEEPNSDWVREYLSIFRSGGIHYGNQGLDINWSDYPNGYCIYSVDMTPNRGASDSSQFNLIRRGTLQLEFTFAKELEYPMSVIIFCEYDKKIEIDNDRNIYTNSGGVK